MSGVVAWVAVGAQTWVGALAGVLSGVLVGAEIGLMEWLSDQRNVMPDLSSVSPRAALARDRRIGIALGAVSGVVCGVLWGFDVPHDKVTDGLVVGMVFGALVSLAFSVWPYYATTRTSCVLTRASRRAC